MKATRLIVTTLLAALLTGCGTTQTVPLTGRKQNLLVSDAQVLSLASQQYSEYMRTAKPSTDAQNTAVVKRVGQRIANAVETYLKANGMADQVKNYQWEFNLVQDNQVNAWCMPGGKIVVYEGILGVTRDEASLAVVMGHEVAHAVARHSAEQMSTKMRQQYGAQALSMVLAGAGASANLQQVATSVWGIGAQGFSAKYSRDNESEADHLGIIFAAMAGYDPQVATGFWQRMSQATGGGSSSWLSSHPTDATRIKQLQGWMPEALKYYKPQAAASASASTPAAKKKTPTSRKKKR